MNPAALFAAHKTTILGGAAAAVAGLALLQKRKKGTSSAAAGTPGTGTATDMPANGFMGPDSSAYDVYNALLPELDALRQTGGNPVGPVPAPDPTSPILQQPAPTPAPAPKPAPKPAPMPIFKRPPAPAPVAKHTVDTWVTVRPGDSLSQIAARFKPTDITWQTLAQQNKITNPNVIKPGQKIHVVG